MGFSSRKLISYKLIYLLVLWLCGSYAAFMTGFKLYRGERDIFTKPGSSILGQSRSTDSCSRYNAECENAIDECDYCRCFKGKNTLVIHENGIIKGCVSDEEIVAESVPKDIFWLKNTVYKECLKLNGTSNSQVVRTNCSLPTLDKFWIWTGNKQLINVKTLKCMERNGRKVRMRQCVKNKNEQKIQCTEPEKVTKIGGIDDRFLHLTKSQRRVIFKNFTGKNAPQQWSSEKQSLCETSTPYNGCYRFSDGSFLKYLDYSTSDSKVPTLSISAPIFKNNRSCKISGNFHYSRDNYTGESETANVFSFKNNKKTIKLTPAMEVFRAWNGSLIKISVICGEEKHCVLLKLASKPSFSEQISHVQKRRETGGTNATAIAVTVTLLVVALALASLGFLVYRRRQRRTQVSQNNNIGIGVVNYSSGINEDPYAMYETPEDDENAVPHHDYIDSSLGEQVYAYAKETDFPTSSGGTKSKAKEQINNGVVYETVGEPDQPNDDSCYNYLENTTISQLNSAIDTSATRSSVPATGTDQRDEHSVPQNDSALYHTLEEPKSPQPPVYSTLEGPDDTDQ